MSRAGFTGDGNARRGFEGDILQETRRRRVQAAVWPSPLGERRNKAA